MRSHIDCGLVEPSGPVEQRPGEIAISQARPYVGEYQAPSARFARPMGRPQPSVPCPHWAARMTANHRALDRCRSGCHALRPQRHEGWDASLPACPEARSRPTGVRRMGARCATNPGALPGVAAPNAARGVTPTAPTAWIRCQVEEAAVRVVEPGNCSLPLGSACATSFICWRRAASSAYMRRRALLELPSGLCSGRLCHGL
jgi:hypothetical protein